MCVFILSFFQIHGKQRWLRNTCKRVQRRVAHCRSSAYDSCEHERSRRCVSSYPRARRCVRHAQCVARTTRTYVPREPRFMPLAANHAARLSAVPRARITATNQVLNRTLRRHPPCSTDAATKRTSFFDRYRLLRLIRITIEFIVISLRTFMHLLKI